MTDKEADEIIKQLKPEVEKLPKRKLSDFDYPQLETRKLYSRAYEYWTPREIEIMTEAYRKIKKIDKVAQLLDRQPSAVKRRIEELNIEI